jgi:hypothetical protein
MLSPNSVDPDRIVERNIFGSPTLNLEAAEYVRRSQANGTWIAVPLPPHEEGADPPAPAEFRELYLYHWFELRESGLVIGYGFLDRCRDGQCLKAAT